MMTKKIKISPSAKSGGMTWINQRVSAIALIPLIIWLTISLISIVQDPQSYMPVFFAYPFNAVMGILLISFSLYHGSIGMKVIIEDYVAHKMMRHFLIMLVHFISITSALVAILAIMRLHLVG